LVNQYLEKYVKKLVGRNDIEVALKRLDKEEARMAAVQILNFTHIVINDGKETKAADQQLASSIDDVK